MDRILKEHFDRFRDKGELPPELCTNSNCKDMQLFGSTDEERELLVVWRNNLKGIRWEDGEGNTLFGAVDNILRKGDKLIVLDYKTRGYPTKEDTALHYQNQLDTYAFLLQKNGYQTEEYGFLLFYVPSKVLETGEVIFETELIEVKTNPHAAEKLFKEAIECLKGECPKGTCEWCQKVVK
jgi:hypothetical protein